jgi:hypothetical protein
MQQTLIHRIALGVCGFTLLAALGVTASAAPGEAAEATETRVAAARSLFSAQHGVSAGAPATRVPDAKLDQQRGGTDTYNTMRLDGSVAGNTAVNVFTGANSIDTGSFANMSGIPVVIQNSGANVLIQNATIINLQFK